MNGFPITVCSYVSCHSVTVMVQATPGSFEIPSFSEFCIDLLFSSVQLLSGIQLFVTPWTAACQASLSIINSQTLLKLMYIKSVMPSNHLMLCHPLLLSPSIFPSIRNWDSFQMSQFFTSGGQSIEVSASASVLPMNIQDLSPLGWTGWISLQSKELSRVFSNTTVQKHQFFSAVFFIVQLSHPYITPGKIKA